MILLNYNDVTTDIKSFGLSFIHMDDKSDKNILHFSKVFLSFHMSDIISIFSAHVLSRIYEKNYGFVKNYVCKTDF